jgi:hypothetical protein
MPPCAVRDKEAFIDSIKYARRTITMVNSFGVNLAVPSTTILQLDNSKKLVIDSKSWMHLNGYVAKVENLPEKFDGVSVATDEALKKLQSKAESFGSPKGLQQLITRNPNLLKNSPPPSRLYAAIVWLVQHLRESATLTISTLQSLPELTGSYGEVKSSLILLENKSGNARNQVGPIVVSLKKFKGGIIATNNALADAFQADVELLHLKQERVGALQIQIEGVQKKISELGFFSSKERRKELEQELGSLQQELQDTMTQSEKLRLAIGELESILADGAWLKSGLDDIVQFFDNIRKIWTAFGSGLTQLAVDATDAQLENLTFVKQALGLDEAIKQWTAIDQAAKQFVVESLVDISSQ